VLNSRILKRFRQTQGRLAIGLIGTQADLTYDYEPLGAGPEFLAKLASGSHPFLEKMKGAERPLVIIGQAALARALTRLGGAAHLRNDTSLADQVEEPLARIIAVAPLSAVAVCLDDENPIGGQALPGQSHQPPTDILRQRRRALHVEAQLHRRGDLVHVLPARPRRTHKTFHQLARIQRDTRGH